LSCRFLQQPPEEEEEEEEERVLLIKIMKNHKLLTEARNM
jgi:hypothetical protein